MPSGRARGTYRFLPKVCVDLNEVVLEAVKAALDLGADLNAVDNTGEMAMQGAA